MTVAAESPTTIVWGNLGEIHRHNRWNPGYYEERFRKMERQLHRMGARPLGEFIPDALPNGSKGITYGQVGSRELNPRGAVRYLQVINLRDTGIDFAIKPDRVAEGSPNDPPRSRVEKLDILFTNTTFRGADTLIGRCVVVPRDYGKLNISQDIDRIRVLGMNPYFVGVFLKTRFGQLQIQRYLHGVDSQKINFGHIRSLLVPDLSEKIQLEVERQYLEMAKRHDMAMAIKEGLLGKAPVKSGRYGESINALASEDLAHNHALMEAKERLDHLVGQLEAVISGDQKKIAPFTK
jgi:hypothetical protein